MGDSIKDTIIAVICSGAFFTFIQFLIQRWDTKKGLEKKIDDVKETMTGEVDNVRKDVSELSNRLDEHRATLARTHILRFADELRNGTVHSEEYFKQQLQDITVYNQYCDEHPNFKNKLTVMSSKYIEDEFNKLFFHGKEND